jgi:O-antigen/teichoic acid export membrane protein
MSDGLTAVSLSSPPSEVRTVGKHTLVYGAGVVLSKLASFIMLPVYTRYLTTADYGILELLGTTIDVIGMIAGLGLAAGVFKHYAEMRTTHERHQLIGTLIIATTVTSLAVAVLGFILSPWLSGLLFGPRITSEYFRIVFLTYFFQSIAGLTLMLLQAEERSKLFVILNVAKLIVTLALNIWFVVIVRWGVQGVLISNLVATAVLAIGLGAYTIHRAGVHFSRERFRALALFGTPLVVSTLGSFILAFSDRYFLNHYTGTGAVGVYSLAYKFSFLLSALTVIPFGQIWEPRRFAIAKRSDAHEIYRRMFVYYNLALFIGSIAIVLLIKDVLAIMVGPTFLPAYKIVPILLLTTIIQQWTAFCNLGLFLTNSTKLFAIPSIISVIADLLLNLLLIPRYGILGAAWATAIAYALRFTIIYVLAQEKYYIDYPWRKTAELALIFGFVWAIRQLADGLPLPASLGISVILGGLAASFLYVRMLDGDEKAFIKGLAHFPFSGRSGKAA